MKTADDLCRELGIPLEELEATAALESSAYFFKRLRKGSKKRTLRCPNPTLARIQRTIKERILDRLSLPPTMHGWRKGRSPKTYASKHVGHRVVLNFDIRDFFPSISGGRVCAVWESLGYDPTAARLLTRLTVCDNQLPQGAPTSPSLGNHVLKKLDYRLLSCAKGHALNYSNLADEIAISGTARAERLKNLVLRIIRQEGFQVNPEKVKVSGQHARQELAGIVVNRKLSLGRGEYRVLRATVHNCVIYGPETQNRQNHPNFEAHLRGKIAQWLHINPRLGKRLMREFEKIQWVRGCR